MTGPHQVHSDPSYPECPICELETDDNAGWCPRCEAFAHEHPVPITLDQWKLKYAILDHTAESLSDPFKRRVA